MGYYFFFLAGCLFEKFLPGELLLIARLPDGMTSDRRSEE